MNRELESIIKDDIERCKKLTTVAGSVELFQKGYITSYALSMHLDVPD